MSRHAFRGLRRFEPPSARCDLRSHDSNRKAKNHSNRCEGVAILALLRYRFQIARVDSSKVPEGHHPRGTTLSEALRGNLPLRGLCGVLSEDSAGVSSRVLRGSAGFCGGPRHFPRFFGCSDLCL